MIRHYVSHRSVRPVFFARRTRPLVPAIRGVEALRQFVLLSLLRSILVNFLFTRSFRCSEVRADRFLTTAL